MLQHTSKMGRRKRKPDAKNVKYIYGGDTAAANHFDLIPVISM